MALPSSFPRRRANSDHQHAATAPSPSRPSFSPPAAQSRGLGDLEAALSTGTIGSESSLDLCDQLRAYSLDVRDDNARERWRARTSEMKEEARRRAALTVGGRMRELLGGDDARVFLRLCGVCAVASVFAVGCLAAWSVFIVHSFGKEWV